MKEKLKLFCCILCFQIFVKIYYNATKENSFKDIYDLSTIFVRKIIKQAYS